MKNLFPFTASKVLRKISDFFLSSGCAYINAGLAGKYVAENLQKRSKLLYKKYKTFVINLPTLYNSMDRAVMQVIENYNVVKIGLKNLEKQFKGQ